MGDLIEIEAKDLSPETLEAVIESFVLREGTDYGSYEASLDSKLQAVRTQIKNGKAKVVFDTETETCSILLERELKKVKHSLE